MFLVSSGILLLVSGCAEIVEGVALTEPSAPGNSAISGGVTSSTATAAPSNGSAPSFTCNPTAQGATITSKIGGLNSQLQIPQYEGWEDMAVTQNVFLRKRGLEFFSIFGITSKLLGKQEILQTLGKTVVTGMTEPQTIPVTFCGTEGQWITGKALSGSVRKVALVLSVERGGSVTGLVADGTLLLDESADIAKTNALQMLTHAKLV